jgi:hypothetical protein
VRSIYKGGKEVGEGELGCRVDSSSSLSKARVSTWTGCRKGERTIRGWWLCNTRQNVPLHEFTRRLSRNKQRNQSKQANENERWLPQLRAIQRRTPAVPATTVTIITAAATTAAAIVRVPLLRHPFRARSARHLTRARRVAAATTVWATTATPVAAQTVTAFPARSVRTKLASVPTRFYSLLLLPLQLRLLPPQLLSMTFTR